MIYAIARYIKSIDKRTIIVVPSKGLVEQMYKDFLDYGWGEENLHKIYQGHSIDTSRLLSPSPPGSLCMDWRRSGLDSLTV